MRRKLRIFLCHASQDKPAVRELYKRLNAESWIEPWFDEENLVAGQDFDLEIYKATRDADAIIVCLSKVSVAKEGYVNKEIRRALDIAQEKAEGVIYVIPLRFDDCTPPFERLKQLHWVDYFTPNAHERLLKSLAVRAKALKMQIAKNFESDQPIPYLIEEPDFYTFIQVPPTEDVPYSFYIGKYPITNAQYERFLNASDFANPVYWLEYSMYDENCKHVGDWGKKGLNWLHGQLKETDHIKLLPRYWNDQNFGKSYPNHPIVGVTWYEASAYCEWLLQNWSDVLDSKANPFIKPQTIRLPVEKEWIAAAGGDKTNDRFPWDENEKATILLKDILRRANVNESEIGHTTPVNHYPLGKSSFGVMDMAGNIWEWQANYSNQREDWLALRGGSWFDPVDFSRISARSYDLPYGGWYDVGFRVAIVSS